MALQRLARMKGIVGILATVALGLAAAGSRGLAQDVARPDGKDPSAEEARLVEVSPLATETPYETLLVGVAEPSPQEWSMSTPQPGQYVVTLNMTPGERGTDRFGYGDGDLRAFVEFQRPRPWSGQSKAFRITVPEGQARTQMFLDGKMSLRRVDIARVTRPVATPDGRIRQLAESSNRTVLRPAQNAPGKPACVILAPREGVEAKWARELGASVGIEVADEPEIILPFPASPMAKDRADCNLILLSAGTGGPLTQALRRAAQIGENRAIPGEGGYVIRTIARPFRGKANVIVISGGGEKGLAAGIRAFAPEVEPQSGDLVWNRFLLESPGDRWRDLRPSVYQMPDDDDRWSAWAEETAKPIAATDIRTYLTATVNFGSHYWRTGNVRFADLFKERMFRMERERIYARSGSDDSHMYLGSLLRTWDRVEEAPVFSVEDRLRITNYLLQCGEGRGSFERAYTKHFTQYSGPVRMRQNHQTFLAAGMLQAALYFGRHYDLGRAAIWQSWCDDTVLNATAWGHAAEDSPLYEPMVFAHVARMLHDQGISTRGHEATRHWPEAALRFAALRDSFGLSASYGDCGDLADAGHLSHFAVMRDDWDWPAAQFLIDNAIRGYRHVLVNRTTGPGSPEYAYVQGSTDVGGLLPPSDPAKARKALEFLSGLAAVPMTEGFWRYMTGQVGNEAFWARHRRPEAIPYARTADKIQFRSGWAVSDEYLLLETLGWANHGHLDLGAIVQYCQGGRLWLVDAGYDNLGPEHHSTLEVVRNGQPSFGHYEGETGRWGDFRTGPQMLEITRLEAEQGFQLACRARSMGGAAWERAIDGGNDRALCIADTVTADEPGEYVLNFRLRVLGRLEGKDGEWIVHQDGASLPVVLEMAEGDQVAVAPPMADAHNATGLLQYGRYYRFMQGVGPADALARNFPFTLEWRRTITLARGQRTIFRAMLGPSRKP